MSSQELQHYTVLVVDSDPKARASTIETLAGLCLTQQAEGITDALAYLGVCPIHVMLTRDELRDGDGVDLCAFASHASPDTIRILYGDNLTLERTLAAINRGQVWRYLNGSWGAEGVRTMVLQAFDHIRVRTTQRALVGELRTAKSTLEHKLEQRTRHIVDLNEELRTALDQVQTMVYRDQLTGLLNRRAMNERLEDIFRQTRRYKVPLAHLVCDIEGFQAWNEEHGHEAGDSLLIEVAERIRSHIREVDIPCRVGGDEFALIMPHTSGNQAWTVAERMQRVLAETPYEINRRQYRIRMNFGIAEATSNIQTSTELFRRAIQAQDMARSGVAGAPIQLFRDAEAPPAGGGMAPWDPAH